MGVNVLFWIRDVFCTQPPSVLGCKTRLKSKNFRRVKKGVVLPFEVLCTARARAAAPFDLARKLASISSCASAKAPLRKRENDSNGVEFRILDSRRVSTEHLSALRCETHLKSQILRHRAAIQILTC